MNKGLFEKIRSKKSVVAVLGLGYVGLSLFEALGKAGFSVVGYDTSREKNKALHKGDFNLVGVELPHLSDLLCSGKCKISDDPEVLTQAEIFIIAVPTPIDLHKGPDLSNLKEAADKVRRFLKKGSLVVLQSTSYPGTTEEEILPILRLSKLEQGIDFHLAFVPEISDFGNLKFDFSQIPKIVGGLTPDCSKVAKKLYSFVAKKVYVVSSPKVAEACKILQNTYRLINISFINEMKILLDSMGIDVWEVIDAAAKKPFGFVPFYPGPGVGGDCIPVNAYYLIWKGKEVGGDTSLLELASHINSRMPEYVVQKVIDGLNENSIPIKESKILILGVAFKKDVGDMREAPSLEIMSRLQKKGAKISYQDPYVAQIRPSKKYPKLSLSSIPWKDLKLDSFDAVLILADHSKYNWELIGKKSTLIIDTRNVMGCFPNFEHKVIKA